VSLGQYDFGAPAGSAVRRFKTTTTDAEGHSGAAYKDAGDRTAAEKVLAEARRSARDEYTFGRLALSVSEDKQSRPAAGELPFATREELSARLGPSTADAAFAAEPGIIDRVIETDQGFHVVKVLAREQGREASYDELRESIKARLTTERHEKAFKEFIDALWARANVKIDEKALAELDPTTTAEGTAR
jgi:parvulin-like peptidyl-prolyl isomerase